MSGITSEQLEAYLDEIEGTHQWPRETLRTAIQALLNGETPVVTYPLRHGKTRAIEIMADLRGLDRG